MMCSESHLPSSIFSVKVVQQGKFLLYITKSVNCDDNNVVRIHLNKRETRLEEWLSVLNSFAERRKTSFQYNL